MGESDPSVGRPRGLDSRAMHVGFLLLPEFTMLALSCAIDPMRIANLICGKQLYRWTLIAADGQPQHASCGLQIMVDAGMDPKLEFDRLYVVSGLNVERHAGQRVTEYLRRMHRHGTPLGGICSGAFALARAGLLDGHRCAIHWAFHDGFEERFPGACLDRSVFVADDPSFATAAGGPAASDLMLRIIAEQHGSGLSRQIADQMVYAGVRDDTSTQRLSFSARYGHRSRALSRALLTMEANLEAPLSCAQIARECGVTMRQLQRLFVRFVGKSPNAVYHELRLNRAQALLRQTDMAIIEVALACGFQSPSSFSRNYRKMFGRPPSLETAL